jgi:hypothetical protein
MTNLVEQICSLTGLSSHVVRCVLEAASKTHAIVPLHPTAAMVEAGYGAHPNTYGPGSALCVVHYRAMLAAAPDPLKEKPR